MKMIGIRMILAGQHLPYDYAAKTAAYTLHLLYIVAFESQRGEHRRKLAGSIVEIYIAFKPFI